MAELKPIGHNLVIVTFVFGAVVLTTLAVRLWFRARNRKYDASDSCLIAAMVCRFSSDTLATVLTSSVLIWCLRYAPYSKAPFSSYSSSSLTMGKLKQTFQPSYASQNGHQSFCTSTRSFSSSLRHYLKCRYVFCIAPCARPQQILLSG